MMPDLEPEGVVEPEPTDPDPASDAIRPDRPRIWPEEPRAPKPQIKRPLEEWLVEWDDRVRQHEGRISQPSRRRRPRGLDRLVPLNTRPERPAASETPARAGGGGGAEAEAEAAAQVAAQVEVRRRERPGRTSRAQASGSEGRSRPASRVRVPSSAAASNSSDRSDRWDSLDADRRQVRTGVRRQFPPLTATRVVADRRKAREIQTGDAGAVGVGVAHGLMDRRGTRGRPARDNLRQPEPDLG